jgi:hypothetical protein
MYAEERLTNADSLNSIYNYYWCLESCIYISKVSRPDSRIKVQALFRWVRSNRSGNWNPRRTLSFLQSDALRHALALKPYVEKGFVRL